jgi:hypothetical protein
MQFDTTGLEGYITDRDIEGKEGVWLKFPGDREFLVLRAGGSNSAFSRRFQQLIKPHRKQIDRGTLDPQVSDDLMRQAYCETVVKDWRGIKDPMGTPIPWSKEAGMAFFAAFPELFSEVVELASSYTTFQHAEVEEAKEVLGEA